MTAAPATLTATTATVPASPTIIVLLAGKLHKQLGEQHQLQAQQQRMGRPPHKLQWQRLCIYQKQVLILSARARHLLRQLPLPLDKLSALPNLEGMAPDCIVSLHHRRFGCVASWAVPAGQHISVSHWGRIVAGTVAARKTWQGSVVIIQLQVTATPATHARCSYHSYTSNDCGHAIYNASNRSNHDSYNRHSTYNDSYNRYHETYKQQLPLQ